MGGMGGMGGMGMGAPPIEAVSTDVPYIQCAACKAFERRASFVTKTLREQQKRKPTEDEILTLITSLADCETVDGEWLHAYDLVESDSSLSIKRMPVAGVCGVECKTMALACSKVLNEVDAELATA